MRGVDEPKVSAWMAAHIEGAVAPFEFDLIAGGHSNLTFRVTDAAGQRFVLRRPPLGHVLATAHDMAREHRIISAVGATAVPVAPALGLCTDDDVNGAPFYVMGFVDGLVLDSPERAAALAPEIRRTAAINLIDVLANLHAVDVDEVGLGTLARREAYIERQIKRWSAQWENSKTRELPVVEEVERRLRERVPPQIGVAIVHGDYRLGNCLTDPATGRIAAVLDWELCTLGDPLADVGYLGIYWNDDGETPQRPDEPTAAGGFPTYRELVDRYAALTGRDVSNIPYYRAFSHWRLGIIGEGVYARYLHGVMADAAADVDHDRFRLSVEHQAESALAALEAM
jgi:aminoglycoside phosphotransferase (APT) family kinase protein